MKKITISLIICFLFFDLIAQNTGNFYSGQPEENTGFNSNFYTGTNTPFPAGQSQIDRSKFQQMVDARISQRQSQFKTAQSYLEFCQSLKEKTVALGDKEINIQIDNMITDLKEAKVIINQNYVIESFLPFEKRINEIILRYNQKIENYKRNLEIYETGVSNFKSHNYNLAISNFTTIYNDDKFKNISTFYLSLCYFKMKDFSTGEKYLNELKKKTTKLFDLYYAGGWCLYENQKFAEAIDYFVVCISMQPRNQYAYYSRGSAYAELDKREAAISDYKIAIEIDPNFSMAYNNLAWTYYETGNFKLALVYADIAIEKDPENYVAWDSRADIKLKLNDYKGAISDASKAIELKPNMPNSLIIIAKSNYKLGYKTKACEFLVRASAMNYKDADLMMKEYNCGY